MVAFKPIWVSNMHRSKGDNSVGRCVLFCRYDKYTSARSGLQMSFTLGHLEYKNLQLLLTC